MTILIATGAAVFVILLGACMLQAHYEHRDNQLAMYIDQVARFETLLQDREDHVKREQRKLQALLEAKSTLDLEKLFRQLDKKPDISPQAVAEVFVKEQPSWRWR